MTTYAKSFIALDGNQLLTGATTAQIPLTTATLATSAAVRWHSTLNGPPTTRGSSTHGKIWRRTDATARMCPVSRWRRDGNACCVVTIGTQGRRAPPWLLQRALLPALSYR